MYLLMYIPLKGVYIKPTHKLRTCILIYVHSSHQITTMHFRSTSDFYTNHLQCMKWQIKKKMEHNSVCLSNDQSSELKIKSRREKSFLNWNFLKCNFSHIHKGVHTLSHAFMYVYVPYILLVLSAKYTNVGRNKSNGNHSTAAKCPSTRTTISR